MLTNEIQRQLEITPDSFLALIRGLDPATCFYTITFYRNVPDCVLTFISSTTGLHRFICGFIRFVILFHIPTVFQTFKSFYPLINLFF